jgi:hypothetical protein
MPLFGNKSKFAIDYKPENKMMLWINNIPVWSDNGSYIDILNIEDFFISLVLYWNDIFDPNTDFNKIKNDMLADRHDLSKWFTNNNIDKLKSVHIYWDSISSKFKICDDNGALKLVNFFEVHDILLKLGNYLFIEYMYLSADFIKEHSEIVDKWDNIIKNKLTKSN